MTPYVVKTLKIGDRIIEITYQKPVILEFRVGNREWEDTILYSPLAPPDWKEDLNGRLKRLRDENQPVHSLIDYLPPPTLVTSYSDRLPHKIELPHNVDDIDGIATIVETWYSRHNNKQEVD